MVLLHGASNTAMKAWLRRAANLLEGGTDSPQLATPVAVLAGCLGVSEHLIGASQVSLVALPLPLCHHDGQYHLGCRRHKVGDFRPGPSEHVCLQGLAHVFLMLLLGICVFLLVRDSFWVDEVQALCQCLMRRLQHTHRYWW